MKVLRSFLFCVFVIANLLSFQNCRKKTVESEKDVTTNILTSKEWVVSSVNVPGYTATLSADWANFTVSFSTSDITTKDHATGAEGVWPSGTYTVSEDGKTITRHDGVVMMISPISETSFTAIFIVPVGTVIAGRANALEGDYIFTMK